MSGLLFKAYSRILKLESRIKTLEDALRRSAQGKRNLAEFNIVPDRYKAECVALAEEEEALAAKEPTLRGNVNRGCLGCLTDDCKHWDDDSCKEFSGCLLGRNLAAKEPTA